MTCRHARGRETEQKTRRDQAETGTEAHALMIGVGAGDACDNDGVLKWLPPASLKTESDVNIEHRATEETGR